MTTITPTTKPTDFTTRYPEGREYYDYPAVSEIEAEMAYYYAYLALAPVAKGLEKEERAVRICGRLCWTIGDVVRVLEMVGEAGL